MIKYGKSAGRDVVWLEYHGELISDFEPKHELIVDDIISMEATISQQAQELEYAAENLTGVELELDDANKRIADLLTRLITIITRVRHD